MAYTQRPGGRNRHLTSKMAKQAEVFAANRFSARMTSGSGNQWYEKGDLRSANAVFEVKNTSKDTYRVSTTVIKKVKDAARQSGADFWCLVGVFNKEFADPLILCVVPLDLVEMYGGKVYEGLPLLDTKSIGTELSPHLLKIGDEVVVVLPEEDTKTLLERSITEEGSHDMGKLLSSLIQYESQSGRRLGVVGGSDLGKCIRKAWYRLKCYEPQSTVSEELSCIFEMGHAIHSWLQAILHKVFYNSTLESLVELPEYDFAGSADLCIYGPQISTYAQELPLEIRKLIMSLRKSIDKAGRVLVEIKSCTTTPMNPLSDHVLQAGAYAYGLGCSAVIFLYVNKTSGAITTYYRKLTADLRYQILTELEKFRGLKHTNDEPERSVGRQCDACGYRRNRCFPDGDQS